MFFQHNLLEIDWSHHNGPAGIYRVHERYYFGAF